MTPFSAKSALVASAGLWCSCQIEPLKTEPDPNRPESVASSGNTSSDDGGTNATSGAAGNGADATNDVTTGGPIIEGEWVSAVGNLAGESFECGVDYVSVKPNEDAILAGFKYAGLFKSDDQGEIWSPLGTGEGSALVKNGPMAIIYDPDDHDVFWEAGIHGPSPFKTEDGGKTFVQLGNIDQTDLISIDFNDPERRTLLAGTHEEIEELHLSTDSGHSWVNIFANLPASCKYASYPHILDSETFLLGCWTSIARSTDAGANWSVVSDAGGAAAPLIASDGTIYWQVERGDELFRSKDDGETWDSIPVPNGHFARSTPPVELPDGRLAVAGREAVLVSAAGGGWVEASPNYPAMPSLPIGIIYAKRQKAFYVWGHTCDDSVDGNEVYRYDFDHERF